MLERVQISCYITELIDAKCQSEMDGMKKLHLVKLFSFFNRKEGSLHNCLIPCSTGPFPISDLEIGEFYVVHKRRATDFEAPTF